MTIPVALHAVAASLLGPCAVSAVLGPAVVRVATQSGDEYVVKQHSTRSRHQQEVYAYRHCSPGKEMSAGHAPHARPRSTPGTPTPLPGRP